jgi:hypothetical protein
MSKLLNIMKLDSRKGYQDSTDSENTSSTRLFCNFALLVQQQDLNPESQDYESSTIPQCYYCRGLYHKTN